MDQGSDPHLLEGELSLYTNTKGSFRKVGDDVLLIAKPSLPLYPLLLCLCLTLSCIQMNNFNKTCRVIDQETSVADIQSFPKNRGSL